MEYHIIKAEITLRIPSYPEDGETLEQSEFVAERRLQSVLDCSWTKIVNSHIEEAEDE